MRYVITFLIGIGLTFAVNAATLQEKCSWGAKFAENVAVARLNGHSKQKVLENVSEKIETKKRFKNLKRVVDVVYGLNYRQVKEHKAVRVLFYNFCMERNSTRS